MRLPNESPPAKNRRVTLNCSARETAFLYFVSCNITRGVTNLSKFKK
jgi:hypothetical protein